jgi:hypothetical protein
LKKLYDFTDPKYERSFDRPNPYIAGRGYERKVPIDQVGALIGGQSEDSM